jgi:transcriptional regulator with XRE-family HTH domain
VSRRNKLLKKLKDKEYRDEFLGTTVRGSIAYQIQALRRQLKQSQEEFAETLGKKQTQVSRLESAEYSASVQTLIEVASALGIGLLVRFVGWPELLDRTEDMSDAALAVTPIDELPAPPKSTMTYDINHLADIHFLDNLGKDIVPYQGDILWQHLAENLRQPHHLQTREGNNANFLWLYYLHYLSPPGALQTSNISTQIIAPSNQEPSTSRLPSRKLRRVATQQLRAA